MSLKQLKILYTHVALSVFMCLELPLLVEVEAQYVCMCKDKHVWVCMCVYELGFVIGGKVLRETHIY